MMDRKQAGLTGVIFLTVLTVLLYLTTSACGRRSRASAGAEPVPIRQVEPPPHAGGGFSFPARPPFN